MLPFRPILVALAALVAAPASAQLGRVAEPGEWIEVDGARVRVLLASASPDGTVDGAVEIDLEPGWKTYWIAPGPAGIPPSFQTDASRNLVLEAIDHPAPVRLVDEFGTSIGYDEDVTFPLRLAMPDPTGGADLALTGFLGVCDDICVPIMVRVAGPVVTGQSTPFETTRQIAAAREALPPIGEPGALTARKEDGEIVLTGSPIVGASSVFVAPPNGLSIDLPFHEAGAVRVPIRSGTAEGELTVVVTGPSGSTRYAVPLPDEG